MRFPCPALFLLALFAACSAPDTPKDPPRGALRTGSWRMELDLRTSADNGPVLLPFLFDVSNDSGAWHMVVRNGSEHIAVDDIELHNDSIRVRMPLFDSEFIGSVEGDSVLRGQWHNYLKGPDYRIPFVAHAGQQERFDHSTTSHKELSGNWECHFAPNTPDAYNAIGIFQEANGRVTGTFGTETGDYRYLEGITHGDSLLLSAFDGSHAFLFRAVMRNDSVFGDFRSGVHSQEAWVGVPNANYALRDPDSLTFLKEGYDMADFRFPCLDGDTVSPRDEHHRGHVMMVQVMGSWCPNCVDETLLLDEMYADYHAKGLDVIAIAFERYPEKERALNSLRRFKQRLHVDYDIVYAGEARKEVAAEKLPFLDHVMSYPTCIFIDRAGKVRRIRTGFYGPGTGEHYANYKRNLRMFIEQMLAEPPAA
jgi:thiol-disulfide isomerase/thioredoxin